MKAPTKEFVDLLTLAQLEEISPRSNSSVLNSFVGPLNEVMKEFSINTVLRKSAFLAQLLHESASFYYMQELASGHAYDKRGDLGNLEPIAIQTAKRNNKSVGAFYKGHGPIQITGYYNHLKCGEALGLDLVNYPLLITEPLNGCRSAGWYWDSRKLNRLADDGHFTSITKRINGGLNGQLDREMFYDRSRRVLR
jgi:putative chitinase